MQSFRPARRVSSHNSIVVEYFPFTLMYRQAAESAMPVARLRGMSDFSGSALRRRDALQGRLTSLLDSYGYQPLDTPLLEPTELFLRKSGGELASQLFSFTDPAGQSVSLRPEFTAPAIRHYLDNPAEFDLPARWRYCGPVFRFDSAAWQGPAPLRNQFVQVGAELLGSDDVLSDVELLSVAVAALTEAGITGWTLRLSDLGVLNSLMVPAALSDRARAFVVESVPRMSEGRSIVDQLMQESQRLHIVGRPSEDDYLSQAVQGLDDDEARSVLLGVLRSNPLDQLGQRAPEEVVERLLRKIRRPDAGESLRFALESTCELALVRGDPATCLDRARQHLSAAGADTFAVDRLQNVIEMLAASIEGSGEIVLDFGLVRGLAYYNGLVFEVSHPAFPAPLGGGGRYDGLARDLGGAQRLPALGFAYNLDALNELSDGSSLESPQHAERTLVVPVSPAAAPAALRVARELRKQGGHVSMEVSGRSEAETLAWASRQGYDCLLSVREDGDSEAIDCETGV